MSLTTLAIDDLDLDSWSWGASNVSLSQGNGLGDQIDIESWSWGAAIRR